MVTLPSHLGMYVLRDGRIRRNPRPRRYWHQYQLPFRRPLRPPNRRDQMGFDDLAPTPCCISHLERQRQEDASLEYISRMLMEEEEDMDGRSSSLLQYHDDHPVLVQVQQSLARIISSSCPSSDSASTTEPCPAGRALLAAGEPDSSLLSSPDAAATFFIGDTGTRNVTGEAEASLSRNGRAAYHNWSNVTTMSSLTGKGMVVEASKFFLPRDSSSLVFTTTTNKPGIAITGHGEGKTMPGVGSESEVSRASKLMAMAEPEEEPLLQEMMNRMMLNDCEVSKEEKEVLRAAIKNEAAAREKARQRRKQLQVVDLHALLVRCAETVMEDHRGARELLEKIKRHASRAGDATQRLAHCFVGALEARLAGTAASILQAAHYPSPCLARKPGSSVVEFLRAYRLYVATCCFKKVAFAFSNAAICRAAAGRSRLHVVDYGIGFGFQWASLLRTLAAREGGPPELVTITGIDLPQPGFRPTSRIEKTGRLLSNCAFELGVPFKFQAIASARWETVRVEDLSVDPDAALVVNSLFRLEALVENGVVVDRASRRDVILGNIRQMRPAVFTLGVVNYFSGSSFLTRFWEALFNYSAMFDVLDATMPRGSQQRLVLERDIMGPFSFNVIACGSRDRADPFDSYKQWQRRMQRAGLRQLPLDRSVVGTVRNILKQQQYHKDFLVEEDDRWLLQGWKGRILYAHSTWMAGLSPSQSH